MSRRDRFVDPEPLLRAQLEEGSAALDERAQGINTRAQRRSIRRVRQRIRREYRQGRSWANWIAQGAPSKMKAGAHRDQNTTTWLSLVGFEQ